MIEGLQRGKIITAMLRDRGRSRQFMIKWLQDRQQKRLGAILKGKLKLASPRAVANVPVSITSWTPRKGPLPLVLLSMIEQTLLPSTVHVWLCPEDRDMISEEHRVFFGGHGVLFHECDNIGPHKKWLPLIESGYEDPFVIADDDTFYPKDWFSSLVGEGERHPGEVVAHRCHRIAVGKREMPDPYARWQRAVGFQKEASHDLFPVGCGGVMVRPEGISEEFRRRELIAELCHKADDIWLKAAYLHSGFRCRKSRYEFPSLDYPGTTQSGLAVDNVDGGGNDQQFRRVLDHFGLTIE